MFDAYHLAFSSQSLYPCIFHLDFLVSSNPLIHMYTVNMSTYILKLFLVEEIDKYIIYDIKLDYVVLVDKKCEFYKCIHNEVR